MAKKTKASEGTSIGLNMNQSKELAELLNNLLANYQLFYINVRGFHWNITGEKFFELHVKFEELYNNAFLKIDEIAERVLTLGFTPFHSYESYLANSTIKSATEITNGKEAVEIIVKSFQILLGIERKILQLSADADDEGTNAQMSDYIREQEKLIWMYGAFLK